MKKQDITIIFICHYLFHTRHKLCIFTILIMILIQRRSTLNMHKLCTSRYISKQIKENCTFVFHLFTFQRSWFLVIKRLKYVLLT
jgi:hypothetical protein